MTNPEAAVREAYRAGMKRLGLWGMVIVGVVAALVGLWFLWRGIKIGETITDLLWEMGIATVAAIGIAIVLAIIMEGRTRVQQIVMPSADENHSLLDWIGRLVRSRSALRRPMPIAPTPQLEAIEKDPVAMAVLAGLGMIGAGIRSGCKWVFFGLIIMGMVWAFAPLADSLAP